MNYFKDTKKARYIVQNPEKYIGTKHPVFKSLWEQNIFFMLDNNPYIKRWGYECQPIPYHNSVTNKSSIYYPDIFFHMVDSNGKHKQYLLEIKPFKFTRPPATPKSSTAASSARYKSQMAAYMVNVCKWQEAEKWCKRHNVNWMIVTEKDASAFTRHKK